MQALCRWLRGALRQQSIDSVRRFQRSPEARARLQIEKKRYVAQEKVRIQQQRMPAHGDSKMPRQIRSKCSCAYAAAYSRDSDGPAALHALGRWCPPGEQNSKVSSDLIPVKIHAVGVTDHQNTDIRLNHPRQIGEGGKRLIFAADIHHQHAGRHHLLHGRDRGPYPAAPDIQPCRHSVGQPLTQRLFGCSVGNESDQRRSIVAAGPLL
jgi:hypothetical protein